MSVRLEDLSNSPPSVRVAFIEREAQVARLSAALHEVRNWRRSLMVFYLPDGKIAMQRDRNRTQFPTRQVNAALRRD